MTRNSRSKQNIERKIVELYIRLNKRKTTKIARRQNLKKRLEFFKALLQETTDAQATEVLAETDQSVTSLSTTSVTE
jgi:hypothetical protein